MVDHLVKRKTADNHLSLEAPLSSSRACDEDSRKPVPNARQARPVRRFQIHGHPKREVVAVRHFDLPAAAISAARQQEDKS